MRIAPGLTRARTGALVLALGGLLGACAGLPPEGPAATRYAVGPAATWRAPSGSPVGGAPTGGRYKVGAPYQQFGVWYVPAEQPDYDAVGLASWYGDAFDHKRTANGEIFDMRAVSAAHATLPMPCLVEVTNLENGRTMVVRMNDRGPYHPGRIIDLSHAGADRLGFTAKGTAKVRVRYVGPAPLNGGDPMLALAPHAGGLEAPALAAAPRLPPHAASVKGRFVIQAGAFARRDTAERAASQLASAGSATVTPVNRGGATLYRVVVGAWDDRDAAQGARGRIAALGFEDAKVSEGL